MKKVWTLLMGIGLAAMLTMPAMAAELRARIKTVNADQNTITVTSRQQDQDITVNADTKYLNPDGNALADGIKSGDLKAGTRVTITYDTKDGKNVASQIQIRKPGQRRQGAQGNAQK
ncbi:MAG: DUF1344 domain-containing protein [Abitibacteriaceae bacterium]|nr:DUF1344 domain-containing protein [Abditibacteriaceae bacterium]